MGKHPGYSCGFICIFTNGALPEGILIYHRIGISGEKFRGFASDIYLRGNWNEFCIIIVIFKIMIFYRDRCFFLLLFK